MTRRLSLLVILPFVFIVGLGARLAFVQVAEHDYYSSWASRQHHEVVPIRPKRGEIRTQDGIALAISAPAYAVYAETRLIEQDHRDLARRVGAVLNASTFELEQRFKSGRVVTLARKVDMRTKERLELIRKQFDLSPYAIRFEEEGKRYYPMSDLGAHVVGYVGLDEFGDNKGLDGLELAEDARLRGSTEKYEVARNAVQRRLEPVAETAFRRAFGDSVTLTIHSAVQHAAETALNERCSELQAVGGSVVVTEVKTGRVLALASYPSFNLNNYARASADQLRNRCTQNAVEPGSVAKILSISLVMNDRLIDENTLIDCEGGRARINRRVIRDAPGHHLDVATVREIFMFSSNVGTDKAALMMDHRRFYEGLLRYGVGRPTNLGLPGESTGFLPEMRRWSGFTMTSLPMGYEMRTTPVQMAQACGTVGNRGVMMGLQIVEEVHDSFGRKIQEFTPKRVARVLDESTAATMLSLMESTVVHGTGKKAEIEGFRVGGKTGTAHKYDVKAGGYTPGMYYSSFCGIFPLSDPEILIYVLVDEPKGAKWGGDVAAPIFQRIGTDTARVLALEPDAPTPVAPLPAESAEATLLTAPPAMAPLLDDSESSESLDIEGPQPLLMPDLRGLTLSEVRDKLSTFPLASRLEFDGTGRMERQQPAPGELYPLQGSIRLEFGPAAQGPMVVLEQPAEAIAATPTAEAPPDSLPVAPLDTVPAEMTPADFSPRGLDEIEPADNPDAPME